MSEAGVFVPDERAESIRSLPFVSDTADGVTFWAAEETGHQETDIDRGAFYAKLCIDMSRACDMPELIGFCMRDMVLAGRFTPLEAGFLGTIASAAKVGSLN